MTNKNKCRVCLTEGATHQIFENIESKESVYSKLFQCFKEKVEDIDGYPRNICDSCYNIINLLVNFITKYQTSCKLLQSSLSVVEKEVWTDEPEVEIKLEEPDEEFLDKDDFEIDWIPFDALEDQPVVKVKKQKNTFKEIKEKLNNLKEINFKRKPAKRNNHRTSKVAVSILEAQVDRNGESLKSSSMKEPEVEKPKEPRKAKKIILSKPLKEPVDQTFLCDICGVVFKDKVKLSRHRKRLHSPQQCTVCKNILKSDYYLKIHMKTVHGNKTLICDLCGKSFALKREVARHMEVHIRGEKFACDKCDKNFSTSKCLVIHERSKHTGDRPAECVVCGARFYHEDYLKEHIRLHTGETPFLCPICGRGYAQRGNMRSHISHNHRLEDLSPEVIKNLKPNWFKYLKKS